MEMSYGDELDCTYLVVPFLVALIHQIDRDHLHVTVAVLASEGGAF